MKLNIALSVLALTAGAAMADQFTDKIVADLTSQGYQRIEIKNGISQVKVEAFKGTNKVELIYDRNTGAILKQESETADADENTAPGLQITNRNRDFLDDDEEGQEADENDENDESDENDSDDEEDDEDEDEDDDEDEDEDDDEDDDD